MKQLGQKLSVYQIIALVYGSLILFGGTILSLPFVSQSGKATPFIDAIFTATSAICVTGQVVYNTAEHWNVWGRTVIISLIEIGGIGFITIWALLYYVFGQQPNLKQRIVIRETLSVDGHYSVPRIVAYVVKICLGLQAAGAFLLALDFVPRFGWIKGLAHAVFHSISAFCNAGFDLFGDSMIGFQDNPWVLSVIMTMIILGGITFVVWMDVFGKKGRRAWSVQTHIVLRMTAFLLVGAFILFALQEEAAGTFSHLKGFDRFFNYLFLAVTPRTAGYANVDYNLLSPASRFLTMVLMFIGGAPGSTAGGIKITTLAIVVLYLLQRTGDTEIQLFKRTVPMTLIRLAVYIMVAGVVMVTVATYILVVLHPEFSLEAIMMEVFSCFGTVGLTMGITGELHGIAQLILILLMFMGRIGLVTFIMSLGGKNRPSSIRYPETNIMIG